MRAEEEGFGGLWEIERLFRLLTDAAFDFAALEIVCSGARRD